MEVLVQGFLVDRSDTPFHLMIAAKAAQTRNADRSVGQFHLKARRGR